MHAQKLEKCFVNGSVITLVVSKAVRKPKEDCHRCRGTGNLGINGMTQEVHHCSCVTRIRSMN